MIVDLKLFWYAAALTAVLLGLVDSGALAFGGSSLAAVAAGGAVLLALGLRLAEPGGWLRRLRPLAPPAWLGPRTVHLFLAPLGLALPSFAAWGGERGTAAAVVLLFLLFHALLGSAGARLGTLLAAGGNLRRELLLPGALLGAALTVRFGLGPEGWLLANLVAWFTVPETPDEMGADPAADEEAGPAAATGGETLAWLLAGIGLAAAAVELFPLLGLYDGGSTTADFRRLLALGLPAVVAGLLFGGAASGRARLPLAALAAAGLGAGLVLAQNLVEAFADPRAFDAVLSDPRWLPRLTDEPGALRLGEDDAAYVPYLALRLGGLAAVCAGVLLRTAVGTRGRCGLGPLLAGAGAALAWLGLRSAAVGHAPFDGPLPWTLFGAGALALAAPLRAPLRLGLAALLVAGPWLALGAPQPPPSSAPFFDNFVYSVVDSSGRRAELAGPSSRLRLLQRGAAAGVPGVRILADGRNFLDAEFDGRSPRRDEAAFLARLLPRAEAGILVGAPHRGTTAAWREAGWTRAELACDPRGLAELLAVSDERWGLEGPTAVHDTLAQAPEGLDLVLVRDEALWVRRRNPLRGSLFRTAARRLRPGGRLAVSFDPARLAPGLVGGTARALQRHFERVELWVVPQGWEAPRLLLLAHAPEADDALPDGVSPLWRIAEGDTLRALDAVNLGGPLSPVVQRAAETEFRRPDRGRSTARAAQRLRELVDQLVPVAHGSLLEFYAVHLEAQVYDVRDDYERPPDRERIELAEGSLDRLVELTRDHPDDAFLRAFWPELIPLVIEKQELGWAARSLEVLTGQLGWDDPGLHAALARTWLDMLLPDLALDAAERALELQPGHPAAALARARALAALGRLGEALDAFAAAAPAAGTPPAELLVPWAEAALEAGEGDTAVELAARLRQAHGDAALTRPLRRLLGLEDPGEVHLLPGMEHGTGEERD